jgi:hypothetical protein
MNPATIRDAATNTTNVTGFMNEKDYNGSVGSRNSRQE